MFPLAPPPGGNPPAAPENADKTVKNDSYLLAANSRE